ncbi:MAG TPA: hypothetical protein VNH22_01230 [Blastocatellia bacterium]|jgi:hypothetical protein|nr:hypothetical protein [Blastocatellia bacterium]
MKRVFGSALALALLCAAAVLANAQGGINVGGEWDMTINSPQGTNKVLLRLKQEGDKLSGTVKNARGEAPLTSAAIKGNDVTIVMTIQFQGGDMVITYTGKAEKDSIKGEADFGGLATGDWSAVRHVESAAAATPATPAPAQASAASLSGVWNFTVETANGTGSPVFTLKQEGENVSGTYKGQFGEVPVTGTVKGNEVTLKMKVNFQGNDVDITYKGTREGDNSMKGKASFGDMGEVTWTATRKS